MNKVPKSTLLLVLPILLFNAAALAQKSKPAPPKPALSATAIAESGAYDAGVYSNKLLGFSMSIPDGSNLLSDELNKAMLQAGKEKVKANRSRELKTAIDKSIARSRLLFQAILTGGAISCGVETGIGAMTADAYLEENKNFSLSSVPNSKLLRNKYRTKFGGAEFSGVDILETRADANVTKTILVTRRKGVILFFVMIYLHESIKEKLEDSLDTLTFEK